VSEGSETEGTSRTTVGGGRTMSCLGRVCHWGPLVAITIIKWVTFVTVYCSSMWWPPAESIGGLLYMIIFLIFAGLTMFHFMCAMCDGPGYLPLGWSPPSQSSDRSWESQLQWCDVCQGYKAPRAHHCRKCGRCVLKMDHHCPWINNCVGHYNHGHFAAFLASAVIGCSMACVCLSMSLYYGLNRTWYSYYGNGTEPRVVLTLWSLLGALFGLGLAIGVVIAVGLLLYFQFRSILRNQTGIEDWIKEKAEYRTRDMEEKFVWPYNVGKQGNLRQVLSWSCWPQGDGITWDVVEGCDQYSLSREQLRQKEDKRVRTREYTVVIPFSGAWFPLSQGLTVCCHPPCTDEPRIRLYQGNLVRVTRWKKHWLYGDKVLDGQGEKRVRGWFPRRCAAETLYHEENCQAKIKESKKKK